MDINETPISEWSRLKLAWAVRNLADALACRADAPRWQVINQVRPALNYLTQFFGEINPVDFTKHEADLSSSLHTWIRKCEDTPESVILYRLIDENRGMATWLAFVRALLSDKDVHQAINAADEMAHDGTTDDIFMVQGLKLWGEESINIALREMGYKKK